jgi:dihydroorotate dehydrogenase
LEEDRSSGRWPGIPVGFNIGKNKDTPLEQAAEDYGETAAQLADLADFFVINLSSPNTPGLRSLQGPESMQQILHAVRERAGSTPLLIKLSPDLEPALLEQTVNTAIENGIAGIVATNTTLKRPTEGSQDIADGGFSGAPLHPLSRACLQVVLDTAQGRVPVVGVGGINSTDRARDILDLGCRVVEIYSALIFGGPGLIRRINRGLSAVS